MDDPTTPATKADLSRLEQRFDAIDHSLDLIADKLTAVINVLANVDKRLTSTVDDHGQRLARLEQKVGLPTR